MKEEEATVTEGRETREIKKEEVSPLEEGQTREMEEEKEGVTLRERLVK